MKRICFVTSGVLSIPAVRGGAVEQLVQQLCEDNEQAPQFKITCITQYDKDAVDLQRAYKHTRFVNFKIGNRLCQWINKKIHGLVRRLTGKSVPSIYIYGYCANRYLKKHAEKFDLIIAEACDPLLLKSLSKKIGREKLCLHIHGPLQAHPELETIYGSILAVSGFIKNNYISTAQHTSQENALILMNGIDLNKFNKTITEENKEELRSKLNIKSNDFVVMFCGRIIKEKGVKELIEAVIGISNPSVKLLIVGSSNFGNTNKGAYQNEVVGLSQRYKDRIVFTGFVKNEELWKYYKIADIAAVPSRWQDPCPLVMFEILASGLPSIATRMGGIPEIASSETTIFIENDFRIIDSLRNAIALLYSSPNMRKEMSQAARQHSRQFDRKKYFETFCNRVNYLIGKTETKH